MHVTVAVGVTRTGKSQHARSIRAYEIHHIGLVGETIRALVDAPKDRPVQVSMHHPDPVLMRALESHGHSTDTINFGAGS